MIWLHNYPTSHFGSYIAGFILGYVLLTKKDIKLSKVSVIVTQQTLI